MAMNSTSSAKVYSCDDDGDDESDGEGVKVTRGDDEDEMVANQMHWLVHEEMEQEVVLERSLSDCLASRTTADY
jgi:hypothetical protein